MSLVVVPDVVAIAVCAVAAVLDQRSQRIPNELTFAALGLGLALAIALGTTALTGAVLGAAFALVVFGVPAAFGLVGMGDVKLMAALGALVRWPLALPLVLYVGVAGGLVAGGYGLATRGVRGRMPYGLAIALGCAWAVASRYVDVLRLV